MAQIELGLIGSAIGRSRAPALHEMLGRLTGRSVRYALHDLAAAPATDVAELLAGLAERGVRGVNVTHPFKELVAGIVPAVDASTSTIGAVNTVRFDDGGPGEHRGYNTDHSGFVAAFRHRFGQREPGIVAQLGAGGVGRAVGLAVAELGAASLRVHDPDRERAERLAKQVVSASGIAATVHPSAEDAASGAAGLVNCSPVGMHHHPGCPIDAAVVPELGDLGWAFDAVYTPQRTEFLTAVERAGADTMSGFELFLWQGFHSFEIFHRTHLDDTTIATATNLIQALRP